MFLGVKAHHDAERVKDYASAEAALERASKTLTGKVRQEKTHGFHLGANRNYGVTWVRRLEDAGAIAFRLYDTDVVVWHPDNSVEIDNFGTVTTSAFAARFLPQGFHLHHPTARRGMEGGHVGITYCPTPDKSWDVREICFGDVVRFLPGEGGSWTPDLDTVDTLEFPELDKSKAREVNARYHLKEFENWIGMAPRHIELAHYGYDLDECMEALEQRDFKTAACLVPLVSLYSFGRHITPLPILVSDRDKGVTMRSVALLRLAIYDEAGALTTVSRQTLTMGEFGQRMRRVREMKRLDASTRWGPQ